MSRIYIITGDTVKPYKNKGDEIINFLSENNITFTHLFSIVDYHESIGTEITYPDNSDNPWMDGELWDKTKAEYCQRNNIDIMFDGTRRYGDYFTTPFVHFLSIKSGR